MKATITVAIFLSLSLNIYSQNLNVISKGVGLISFVDTSTNMEGFGTGTLIRKWIDSSHFKVYLVTNKHVLPKQKQSKYMLFRIRDNLNSVDSFITITIPIYNYKWQYLRNVRTADDGEDIAVIEFDQYYRLRYLDSFLIPYQLLATKKTIKDNSIGIGTPIFFLGYPSLFYDKRNISPVLRKGFIATDPLNDYYFSDDFRANYYEKYKDYIPEKINGFLIDANVFGGSSGSIVFANQSAMSEDGSSITIGVRLNYILGITTYSYNDLNEHSNQKVNLGGVISAEIVKNTIDLF